MFPAAVGEASDRGLWRGIAIIAILLLLLLLLRRTMTTTTTTPTPTPTLTPTPTPSPIPAPTSSSTSTSTTWSPAATTPLHFSVAGAGDLEERIVKVRRRCGGASGGPGACFVGSHSMVVRS